MTWVPAVCACLRLKHARTHRARARAPAQPYMEAPPEGLASDSASIVPAMLEGPLGELKARLRAALGESAKAAARHAAALGHLAGFVTANRCARAGQQARALAEEGRQAAAGRRRQGCHVRRITVCCAPRPQACEPRGRLGVVCIGRRGAGGPAAAAAGLPGAAAGDLRAAAGLVRCLGAGAAAGAAFHPRVCGLAGVGLWQQPAVQRKRATTPPVRSRLGVLEVHQARLAAALAPWPARCAAELHALLPELAAAARAAFAADVRALTEAVLRQPGSAEEFVEHAALVAGVEGRRQELARAHDHVRPPQRPRSVREAAAPPRWRRDPASVCAGAALLSVCRLCRLTTCNALPHIRRSWSTTSSWPSLARP